MPVREVDPAVGKYMLWDLWSRAPWWRQTVTLEADGYGHMNNLTVLWGMRGHDGTYVAIRWHRSGDVIVIEPRSPERRAMLDGVWLARQEGYTLRLTDKPVAREDINAWEGSGDRARKLWAEQTPFTDSRDPVWDQYVIKY